MKQSEEGQVTRDVEEDSEDSENYSVEADTTFDDDDDDDDDEQDEADENGQDDGTPRPMFGQKSQMLPGKPGLSFSLSRLSIGSSPLTHAVPLNSDKQPYNQSSKDNGDDDPRAKRQGVRFVDPPPPATLYNSSFSDSSAFDSTISSLRNSGSTADPDVSTLTEVPDEESHQLGKNTEETSNLNPTGRPTRCRKAPERYAASGFTIQSGRFWYDDKPISSDPESVQDLLKTVIVDDVIAAVVGSEVSNGKTMGGQAHLNSQKHCYAALKVS